MRFQLSDLKALVKFLNSALRNGAGYMKVSPSYLIRNEDLKLIALEYKHQHFLNDKSPNKYHYSMVDIRELLKKISPQNENIRPFVKYNSESNDFIVDMDKMYKVYDRIAKINIWKDLRKEFQQSGSFLAKNGDAAFVEIINKNLKRLCDFDGGYVIAMDWIKSNPDKLYIVPQKFPVYPSSNQRCFTYDDMIRITTKVQEKREGKQKLPRQKL